MRKFRAIIQTNIEPEDQEVLWYYKKTLKYYSDGSWRQFIIQDTDTIPIKNEKLPNINNLTNMLDYLLKESADFKVVNTLEDLNNISISLISDNNICYVTSTDSLYIYKDNIWQQYIQKNTKILTERILIKDIDTSSREIRFGNNLRKYEYIYLAYGDNITSLDNLTIYRAENIDRHWIIPEGYDLPKVGQYLYLVAVSSQELYIPVVISNSELHQMEIRYYKNTDESIFKESVDIREFIYDLKDKVNELFEWKSEIDSQQKIQDANIQKNYIYSKELNAKIDAKVIEAGGVAFDIEPTENSKNAVFSGGVYKYINDKFLIMTEDEYNDLAIKDENTFYFILE